MMYFKNCGNIEELKNTYKALCRKYHPDLCEDTNATAKMQEINEQFEKAFNMMKDRAETADSREPEDSGADENAAEFMVIINSLVRCEGLTVELIGKWIWVGGNSYPYRDLIKKLGFRWASKKRLWYWHREEDVCRSRRDTTIEQIKNKYGVKRYATATTKRLTAV